MTSISHSTLAYPLTSPQREIWFDNMLHADTPLYNIGGYMRLEGALDIGLLRRSLELLVQKHDVLRTVLVAQQSDSEEALPLQMLAEQLSIEMPVHDFSMHGDPDAAAQAWMRQQFCTPFSLPGAPLFRYALLKPGTDSFLLFACYHHLIADGWTIALMTRSHAEIYNALLAGIQPELAAPSYLAFIEDDSRYAESETFDKQRQYWLQKFHPLPEPLLSPRHHEPALESLPPSDSSRLSLPRDWYNRLAAFASARGASPVHVILGALYVYFTRTEQRDEIVMGLPVLNRSNASFKATAGMFVGVTAARFDFGTELTFNELLRAIGRELKQNYRHQRFPVSDLNRDLGRIGAAQAQLFDLGVSYERHDHSVAFGQAQGIAMPLLNQYETTPLMLQIREFHDDEAVEVDFIYRKAYFSHDEIVSLQQRLMHLLDAIQQEPLAPIKALPLVTEDEYRKLIHVWNTADTAAPQAHLIHQLIERQAQATPDATALMFEERQLSYRELNEAANRLAHRLIAAGVQADSLVGICAERSIEMMVGLVAILKAGGAYVPLDPDYPRKRLADMLEDTGARWILTQPAVWERVDLMPAHAELIALDGASVAGLPATNPQVPVHVDQLAYVIYTSGSTGRPKGAQLSHRNVTRLLSATHDQFRFDETDTWTMFHSYAFDFSVWEIFGALCFGGRLVIVPYWISRAPDEFAALLKAQQVTVLNQTPSAFRQLIHVPELHEPDAQGRRLALRHVIFGGEALEPESLRPWIERVGDSNPRLINMYGITETTVHVTYRPITQADLQGQRSPVGIPIPDLQLRVLDTGLQLLPIGAAGELYVAGAGLARGYLNRPDLTAERFIPDPYGPPGSRMYKTGDLVRWTLDGQLEYLGRIDQQVKIRGFRIELGEIEATLLTYPGVREAVVVVREDTPGDKRLVAYLAANEDVTAEGLRVHLHGHLPDYMTPAAFVFLQTLPLNQNGKVDRKALPTPDISRNAEEYVPPGTPTEILLAELWTDLLGHERVGVHDNFFTLGGHSLLAAKLVSRLRKQADVELPLRAIFETPVLQTLAQRIDTLLCLSRAAGSPPAQEARPVLVDRSAPLPLSFTQQRFWFLDQMENGNAFYNMSGGIRLLGTLDTAALEGTLNDIVQRHEALRTTFEVSGDNVVQVIADRVRVPFTVTDLSDLPAGIRETEARQRAEAEAMQGFDLRTAPMLRAHLLRLGEGEHWLLLCLHHIAADGWSMAILHRELAAFYHARRHGVEPNLPALPLQYADFAAWQRQLPQKAQWTRELDYWRQQLQGVTALLDLPIDHPRPAVQSYRGSHLRFTLPAALTEQLNGLSQGAGATLFMTLISAFGILLSRYSGQDDLCIGTPIANRRHAEFDNLVGCFVNTLVLRLQLHDNPSFAQLLGQMRETALEAYAHQDIPFEQLVDALQPERTLNHAPLFQVMFVLQNNATHTAALNGVTLQPLDIDLPVAKFDLTLHMQETADGLTGLFEYNTDLFERATIERLCGHFQTLLTAIVDRPGAAAAELPLLSVAERQQMLVEWNRTRREHKPQGRLLDLYAQQVKNRPDHPAVIADGASLSYRQLDEQANRLAHYLRTQHAVGPDTLVALCMERSCDMIVGMLGILKAGGAYVPLDPSYPAQRLQQMLNHARPSVLLTQERVLDRLPRSQAVAVCVDAAHADIAACPTGPLDDHTAAANLAYVIYTSGSTGEPKGVAVSRGNLLHSTRARIDLYAQPVSRFLMPSSSAFDSSVAGIFWTLFDGGTLCLPPEHEHNDALALARLIERHAISHLLCIPSFYALLLDTAHARQLAALSTVIVAGEACGAKLVEQHYATLPQATLFNEYGPTENSVWSTVHRCEPQQDAPSVPIGKPIDDVQIHILDACLEPVPVGVTGELYIGGEGLARGYLDRPDITAEKFLPCPFSEQPGARMYRSGDLARWLPDGSIDYLGRADHQVKIRGFRIEPSEIEAALLALPAIREAAVLAREDQPGNKRLVAYVVRHSQQDDATPAEDLLKASLEKALPRHMVPDRILVLEQMPLTPNGKIDRKALPVPALDAPRHDHVAPRTRTETLLAEIWMDLLGHEPIGVHDNFFTLGGHSLLAARLVSRLRKLADVELPLRAVFEAPVLQALAQRIDMLLCLSRAAGTALPQEMQPVPADRTKPLPLSFTQQRLWFLDQMERGNAFYNMSGGLRLRGMLNAAALQAALNDIVQRHEALRTSFDMIDDNAVQVIVDQVPVPFAITDLSGLPVETREAEARRLAEAEAMQGFDLRAVPMLRAHLLRLSESEHWLLLNLHHIVTDGWSMAILQREIAAFYDSHATDMPPALPALPLQYADFAAWQRKLPQGAQWTRELDYWRNQLHDAPALLELPTDYARPAAQSYRGKRIDFRLPSVLAEQLRTLSQDNGATLFMTLLGAFGVLLSRYSAQDDLCIGTPIANRRHTEFDNLIGCFVNMLVLRLKLHDNPAFPQLLNQVREMALDAYAHQDLPFEQLVDTLQPERDLSHAPLFQVMFALENNTTHTPVLSGLTLQTLDLAPPVAKFDLTLLMREEANTITGTFEYSTDLFERTTIERMAGHFTTLLTAIATQPAMPVAELDMLAAEERHFLLEALNQSRHDFPLDQSYAALFAEQVARHPDKIAAVCMDESLTYRELDLRSTRIAHALIAAGTGPDILVGTMGERGLSFLAMMIAIFKAGAAYVPLDINHPDQRLREIVARGRIPLILASEHARPRLDSLSSGLDHAPRALIAEALWLDGEATPLPAIGSPDDLAYVIFTSGSTGQPKGAMVEHKGMLNNLFGKIPAIGLGSDDRVAQTASPAFDISVWQFLAAPLLGGTVHILPDPVSQDPQRLLEEVAAQQVNILQVVPSMMRHLVEVPASHLSFSLRWVLSIGEALPPSLAQAWFSRFPAIPLLNIYGPAECADNVAFQALHSLEEAQAVGTLSSVPVGRPTANNQLFVLDAQLRPLPVGVPGEICIAGTGVGRGYLNDPETTAKAFIDHPFQPGARFYRTGDRGRYRPDGAIDYLGRRDHQIKIRGQRIELGEIESQLRRQPGVRDAVVIGYKDADAEVRLVAYWVPQTLNGIDGTDAEALRSELGKHLPQPMVPTHFVMLERLPVNANGKVDRKALAALPVQQQDRLIEALATSIEERLAVIWSALLGVADIGRDDNFFHLGGHSLLATQVVSQIRKVFGIELPLRALFETPLLRELALRIEQAQQENQNDEAPLQAQDRNRPLPLSFSQQRLWFLDQLEPGSALYLMPGGLRLRGDLDTEALEGALNDIVTRHEALRTVFQNSDGATIQRIVTGIRVPFVMHDLSTLAEEQRSAEARRLIQAEISQPFDLHRAPLLRAQLLRLEQREHWLILTMHHIAADGWSVGIVLRELAAFYRARRQAVEPALPALPIQYADFSVWQHARQQGPLREQQLDYWRKQLAGVPALLDLPTDHPRPVLPSWRGSHVAFDIDDMLTTELRALSRRAQATLFMTLSATFALLLSRYSRQDDICIGTPVANRQRHEVEDLIGFFVNTLVLRFRVQGTRSFEQLLQQSRETALAAYAHQDMPFEQLVEALQPERHPSHSPLFQVMFALQNTPSAPLAIDGLQTEALTIDMPPAARFDLTLNMSEQGKHLHAVFEYNTDLFERETIERLSRHFVHLLQAIVARPDTAVAELPLLSSDERHRILIEWNRTHADLPAAQTIHQLFESCAERYPDQIAAVFEEQRLSYAELNAKANRLAWTLREHGIGADELVGICADRSLDMIVAVIAVLKAGGAYLPLDPALPPTRMAYMLANARPQLLLTQAHLLDHLPETDIPHACLDLDAALLFAGPAHNPPPQTRPAHLAYVIYTSGSTGNPKGTLIHHRALVNLTLAQQDAFDLQPGKRVLQWASFNFDASVSEIFTALTAGARLYLAPGDAVLPGQNLLHTLRRHRIELVTLTPSSLSALPPEPLPDLKTLVVAGEHCDHALIAPWMQRYTVINAYGPTEATVCATVYPCSNDGQRHPPIGRPIANTQTYILDPYLNPVPIGVIGELYIGGEGLARGYLGRPDLTAERFTQNPFSEQPGARMYQTGDLVRYLPDGHIEYIGRIDHQVKIRGYRVELGEIEFTLDQLPSVHEAVVLAQRTPDGDQRLVAYVVPEATGDKPTANTLRVGLGRTLPDYMVPSYFVFLPQIPINTNGKIDRKALDALEWMKNEAISAPPRTPTEQRLATIWSELLGKTQAGRDDNFFHSGGHSLLAVRLTARINEAFECKLPVSQIFLSPTIATIAKAIDARATAASLVVPLKAGAQGAPVWFIHPAGGTIFCYRKLADRFDEARPVYAIQSPEIAGLENAPGDFDSLCQRYIADILRLQPEGPIYLAGWSLGGALSFSIAGMLEQAGRQIGWVGIFDTMLANQGKRLNFEEFAAWALTRNDAGILAPDGGLTEAYGHAARYIEEHGIDTFVRKLTENPDHLTEELGLNADHVEFLRQQYRIQQAHAALMTGFVPGKIRAPLHVFQAEQSVRESSAYLDWLDHTDDARHSTQQVLPGRHETVILIEENIEAIVQVLASRHANPG